MKSDDITKHSLENLASLSATPVRTIRYYIQIGLVDRPIGEKRAAHYTLKHLDQLLTIKKWQAAGLSLDRIKEILLDPVGALLPPSKPRGSGAVEVWSHVVVSQGLEVHIEPGQAGITPEELREFVRQLTDAYEAIRQKHND